MVGRSGTHEIKKMEMGSRWIYDMRPFLLNYRLSKKLQLLRVRFIAKSQN